MSNTRFAIPFLGSQHEMAAELSTRFDASDFAVFVADWQAHYTARPGSRDAVRSTTNDSFLAFTLPEGVVSSDAFVAFCSTHPVFTNGLSPFLTEREGEWAIDSFTYSGGNGTSCASQWATASLAVL